MPISLLAVPYHLGRRCHQVGGGPLCYLETGRLTARIVERQTDSTDLMAGVADVNRQLALAVRETVEHGDVPLVLGGNCSICLGVLSGLGSANTGIVWFDAHGDFHTPATSISGNLEGMSLAAAVGHCHAPLRAAIGCGTPVPERNVLLLGVRDLDPGEPARLAESGVSFLSAEQMAPAALIPRLSDLAARVSKIYLHVDIDVLDPLESPGVNFRGPGGLSFEQLEQALRLVLEYLPVAACVVANYNPDHDPNQTTAAIGLRLIDILSEANNS